jgi:hypothetical protein
MVLRVGEEGRVCFSLMPRQGIRDVSAAPKLGRVETHGWQQSSGDLSVRHGRLHIWRTCDVGGNLATWASQACFVAELPPITIWRCWITLGLLILSHFYLKTMGAL